MAICPKCKRIYDYEGWEIDEKGQYIEDGMGNNYIRKVVNGYYPRVTRCKCGELVILEKLTKEIKYLR